jgi:hypothetical protein
LTALFLPERSSAQLNNDFKVVFLKDTLFQNGNSFSFNKVSITNTSSIKQAIGLTLEIPDNWQTLFDARKVFQLAPNETLELPIRVAAAYGALSDKQYSITLTLNNTAIGVKTAYHYTAKVQVNTNWRAALVNTDVKLDRVNKETYFQVRIFNTGNIREDFDLSYNTSLELTVPKHNHKISVRAGRDTIIQVGVIVQKYYLEEFKPQDITILITGADKTEQGLLQHIYSNNTIFRENSSSWYIAPINIEYVMQNFNNKQQALSYFNSSGSLNLENQRSISFNFRSNDLSTQNSATINGVTQNDVSSQYANINYSSKHWKISIGDQTEFGAFLIDGLGARIGYKADNGYSFDAVGVKSRLGDADQFNLKQEFSLGKTSGIINNTLFDFDKKLMENSILNITEYDKTFGKTGQLSLIGGYGLDDIYQPEFKSNNTGAMAGLNYYYNSPAFTIRTINNISGKNFPGLERGVTRSSDEVRFISGKFFFGGIAEYNSRTVNVIDSTRLVSLFGSKTSEYGLRTGFIGGRNSLTVTGSVVNQLQDSLTSVPFRSDKLSVNAAFGFFKRLNLSLSGSFYRTFAEGGSYLKPINAIAAYGTLQNNMTGISFRLDDGPLYYSDLSNYVKMGLKTDRFQIAPYVEQFFFKSALDARIEVDYINDLTNNLRSLSPRLDVFLNLTRTGLSLHFYGNHSFGNLTNINSLNLSVRKTFDLPLVGLKKYSSLKVILYKDANGSNVYDLGDEPIGDASIRIGEQYFTTNSKGEAYYKNIKTGIYSIDLGGMTNLKGWIPKKGYKQQINFDKSQEWYIAYEKSRFLSGKLNLVKDPLSKLEFSASNIRITAISSKGESYTTLTDENGTFFLNLPADTYIVQINTNVFSEEFRVLRETLNADLTTKTEENMVFEIRERKRAINIRKNKSN